MAPCELVLEPVQASCSAMNVNSRCMAPYAIRPMRMPTSRAVLSRTSAADPGIDGVLVTRTLWRVIGRCAMREDAR